MNIDTDALALTLRLEAFAVSLAMPRFELRDYGRWQHYRSLEASWIETRNLRARLLALTGHRRLLTLWTLAMGKTLEYREMAASAHLKLQRLA